jgi:hypothetical protein
MRMRVLVIVVGGVVLGLAVAGMVVAAQGYLAISFPEDAGLVPGPVSSTTVFASLDGRVAGGERVAGRDYRCRVVGRRRYACLVAGHGAGDLRYRVAVDRAACWRARGDQAPPVDGCVTVSRGAGAGID